MNYRLMASPNPNQDSWISFELDHGIPLQTKTIYELLARATGPVSGTGQMITLLRESKIDPAIGLTEGWVAGLLTPDGQQNKGSQSSVAVSC